MESVMSKLQTHKGKTIVILKEEDYNGKIRDFIAKNNFIEIEKDPTEKFQTQIRQIVNKSPLIIEKEKLKLKSISSRAPGINGLIKLHKELKTIRPVVNSQNSEAYNIGKFISQFIRNFLDLPYTFHIRNSTQLIEELAGIKITENSRICSFDITNIYTNIPTENLNSIIQDIMKRQTCNNNSIGQMFKKK